MNAVNSENEKNLQADSWRFWQLINHAANEDSAYHRFIIGNLQTLNKEGIYEELKQFYDKWYSANIMKLVVYSHLPMDELEDLVASKFSLIKNKNVVVSAF
mmetsp:Transcript_18632/g.21402  ORF Transcript_18632/g.21402 Transcript_18632/m.21402 type:complete len:101 (-) Transcript_18632:2235-2537(-)